MNIYVLQFYMITQDKEAYLISKLNSKHIGDDAAVIDGLVYSSDAFFEDTHFKQEWMTPAQIARKAMLVNISDAIAMNAHPKYALLTISIPRDFDNDKIDELMASFESTAKEFGCEIIGGDTIASDKLHISITIISTSDNPLYRTGIEEGSMLAFTGTIGQSKKDLDRLFAGESIEEDSRFISPELRSDFIYRSRHLLRAGMDISDGLFCDTNKLLDINKYGYKILRNISDEMGLSGEEYEMLIAFDRENLWDIMEIAQEENTSLTVFAEVTLDDNRFPCKGHHFQ